jgi:DNA-binding XRE family transcriptional regulator
VGQIYRIFNKNNGKSYVGATTRTFQERYLEGRWWAMTHNAELMDDAFLHGAMAFAVELLADNVPAEELNQRENEFIQKFNCMSPTGYNRQTSLNRFQDPEQVRAERVQALERQQREELRHEFYDLADKGQLDARTAVRMFRKFVGKNQRDFAKMVGISPRILMAFEQGSGNPTLQSIQKMLTGTGLVLIVGRESKVTSTAAKSPVRSRRSHS